MIAAPVFICTKLEAFKGRGNNDFLLSHDLEGIITVVDGRAVLVEEMQKAPTELRQYVAAEFGTLLAAPGFLEAMAGHLPGDAGSQRRLSSLIATLKRLTQLT